MTRSHKRVAGVFGHLWNSAAFIDTVTVEVWGARRRVFAGYLVQKDNRAIGGRGRPYARCIDARNAITGNKIQLRYGKLLPYVAVSPFSLTLWSHRTPVTCADVALAVNGFMLRRALVRISRLEITFDMTGISVDQLVEQLCTRARTFKEFGSVGTQTFYVGGVNSSWRLKIYDKADELVRTEFTLTRRYLAPKAIECPPDIAILRKVNVWECASFRVADQTHGWDLPERIRRPWQKLGRGLPPAGVPACTLLDALRDARIDPSRWIIPSKAQELLREMQRNLVW